MFSMKRVFILSVFLFCLCILQSNAEVIYKNAIQGKFDFSLIPIQELQKKDEENNIKYKYLLALHQIHDDHLKIKGVAALKELSALGIMDAKQSLYEISNWGEVDGLTKEKGLEYLKEAAEGGYDVSQVELGKCYYKGSFGKSDPEQAHYWFLKAAQQGNADALIYTANGYYIGRGVPKDEKKGFEWLIVAYNVLGRNFNKWSMLGEVYEKGLGTPIDLVRAYMCYDLDGTAGIEDKARIAPHMTSEQRSEGLRLSQEWQEKNHVYTMQSLGLTRQKDGSYQ